MIVPPDQQWALAVLVEAESVSDWECVRRNNGAADAVAGATPTAPIMATIAPTVAGERVLRLCV